MAFETLIIKQDEEVLRTLAEEKLNARENAAAIRRLKAYEEFLRGNMNSKGTAQKRLTPGAMWNLMLSMGIQPMEYFNALGLAPKWGSDDSSSMAQLVNSCPVDILKNSLALIDSILPACWGFGAGNTENTFKSIYARGRFALHRHFVPRNSRVQHVQELSNGDGKLLQAFTDKHDGTNFLITDLLKIAAATDMSPHWILDAPENVCILCRTPEAEQLMERYCYAGGIYRNVIREIIRNLKGEREEDVE